MSSQNHPLQGLVVTVLGAILLVIAAVMVWGYMSEGNDPRQLVLTELSGTVRVTSSAREVGKVKAGLVLEAHDRVATGSDSRATLTLGRETRIRLKENSTVEVRTIDEDGVRIELDKGALKATVRPESGGVRVSNRGRGVLSTGGSFEVGVDEDGILAADAVEGDLVLEGVDAVRVAEGTRATLRKAQANLGPIPEELLLEVDWPAQRTKRSTERVGGRVNVPRARVMVAVRGGEPVVTTADEEGRWSAEVALQSGQNTLLVTVVDPLGQTITDTKRVQLKDAVKAGAGTVDYGSP